MNDFGEKKQKGDPERGKGGIKSDLKPKQQETNQVAQNKMKRTLQKATQEKVRILIQGEGELIMCAAQGTKTEEE